MVRRRLIYFFLGVIFLFRLLPIILSPQTTLIVPTLLNPIQNKLDLTFASFLPNTEAGLLSGIVLGTKKSLPPRLYEQMQQNGTIHIAVASGMNIALLAGPTLAFLAIFLKRKVALVPLFTLIWFYALLSGFQPPIVRASIMASLLYLAQEFGRKADNVRILMMTGYVMVFVKPVLIFDLGFQLSFVSMLSLIFIQPVLKKSPNWFLRSENFSSTMACQIATLPIIMINFGEYNLISPFINLLVLWVVPYIMQLGLLAAIFSFVSSFIAQLLAYLVYPMLWYFSHISDFFSSLKIFQVWTPRWSWGLGVGYYLVLGRWVISKSKR